jgi:hypothetical protein
MRNTIFLLPLVCLSCGEPSVAVKVIGPGEAKKIAAEIETKNTHAGYLTLNDAENILGETVQKTDSSTSGENGTTRLNCSYTAHAKDEQSGKTGTLYFLLENYPTLEKAKERYNFIKTANEKNGIETLSGLGDEAYFHSDGTNFLFVMVRKGQKVFNLKVNKLTSKTSRSAFDRVAGDITNAL